MCVCDIPAVGMTGVSVSSPATGFCLGWDGFEGAGLKVSFTSPA